MKKKAEIKKYDANILENLVEMVIFILLTIYG